MAVTALTVENFRNYTERRLPLSAQHTLFYGPNGIGKTNLLEALYLLATRRSFRTNKNTTLLHYGAQFFRVSATIDEETTASYFVGKDGNTLTKQYAVNGAVKTTPQPWFPAVVLFSPEQVTILALGPGERRRHLNHLLLQLAPELMRSMLSYGEIVRNRNALLQRGASDPELAFWDEELIALGSRITAWRQRTVTILEPLVRQAYITLGFAGKLSLYYKPNIKGATQDEAQIAPLFRAQLEQWRAKERERQQTLVGPQRDDWVFALEEHTLPDFGSRGQFRSALLALLLAEANLLEKEQQQKPLVLLDDVFGELDEQRRALLPQLLTPYQVVFTATEPPGAPHQTLTTINLDGAKV